MEAGILVRNVDALLPKDWAKPDEEDIRPKKAGRPKKISLKKAERDAHE
jgi:hypothetical protein